MRKARIPPWTPPAATLDPRLRRPARDRLALGRRAGGSGMARGDGRASAGAAGAGGRTAPLRLHRRRRPRRGLRGRIPARMAARTEEHTSEIQSLMRISYAVFCLYKQNIITNKLY